MENSIKQIIDKNGIMVIDGSMSTALEQLGANLNSKLSRQAGPPGLFQSRSGLRDHLQLSGDDSGPDGKRIYTG